MGEFNTITRLVSANVRIIGKTRDTGGGGLLDWPLGSGGGLALVILGLALGDSRVGGMGAVLGLDIVSGAS